MSYVVHLFEHPGTDSLTAALQIHQALSVTAAGPNPRLLQWAQLINARFPSGHPGWLEGPPDGSTGGSAVLSVGLTTAALDQLLPAIVSTALPLGLCVLDEQSGRCYQPGGWAWTSQGRFALKAAKRAAASSPTSASRPPDDSEKAAAAPPAAMAPAVGRRSRPINLSGPTGSVPWMLQRLYAHLHPALEPLGFEASTSGCEMQFTRAVPMGLQSIALIVRVGPRVEPSITLEPSLPHALHRVVRPGRTLACHTREIGPLAVYGAAPEPNPQRDPWYTLRCGDSEMDGLANALAQWLVKQFMPLLDDCKELPGVMHALASLDGPAQTAYVAPSRVALALGHWVTGADQTDAAKAIAARSLGPASSFLRAAEALAGMQAWAGAWKRTEALRQVFGLDQAVTADALAQALIPALHRCAVELGFEPLGGDATQQRFRRESAEVVQTLSVVIKPDARRGAAFHIQMQWESAALAAHFTSVIDAAAAMPDLGPWQAHGAAQYHWRAGPLSVAGIDASDLAQTLGWPDEIDDHVQQAECALRDADARVWTNAMTWAGLAAQLPAAEQLRQWGQQPALNTALNRYEAREWATFLMLARLYRTDWPAYCEAMRGSGLYVKDVEPLLAVLEQETLGADA